MTKEEEIKLAAIAEGTHAVYEAGLRGSTLNPVADGIIKLQRDLIYKSKNLFNIEAIIGDTGVPEGEWPEGYRRIEVTKDAIRTIETLEEMYNEYFPTNATFREMTKDLVVGKTYILSWNVTPEVGSNGIVDGIPDPNGYLSLYGAQPEDASNEELIFILTEDILRHPLYLTAEYNLSGDWYGGGLRFSNITLYEIPEDVVADGLDERMDIIKEEVDDVYQAALNKGIEQGKQAEYDAFWDSVQNLGERTNYQYGFAGKGWTNETFRPKYDIKPTNSLLRCFVNTGITGSLTDILQRQGVVLDTSGADDVQFMFDSNTKITEIPHIVCNKSAAGLFSWCLALVKASIEVNENTAFSSSLHRCDALEELTVLGTIGKNGFDAQYSTKLSRASHESIMAALSTTTKELTVTFSLAAVRKAFETAAGKDDGNTSPAWVALKLTRNNWNFVLN